MIPGIVAQDGDSSAAGPGGPGGPATLLATADFVNGIYDYGGSSRTVTQVISSATNVVGGSGLKLHTTPPTLTFGGDFFNLYATASWTVVITFNPTTIANTILFLDGSNGSGSVVTIYTYTPGSGICEIYDQNDSGSQSRFVDSVLQPVTGSTNKVAVTRTNALAALSLNGAATVSDSTSVTLGATMTVVGIADGSSLGNMGYLQKLEFYSPVFGTDLQSLST